VSLKALDQHIVAIKTWGVL